LNESFELHADPRVATNSAGLDAQLRLLLQLRDKLSQTHEALNELRDAREQLMRLTVRRDTEDLPAHLVEHARAAVVELDAIENELIQVRARDSEDALQFPSKLNAKLAWLAEASVAPGFGPPTAQDYQVFDDLTGRLDEQLDRLARVGRQIGELNRVALVDQVPLIATALP
jgi:hypothetical protein